VIALFLCMAVLNRVLDDHIPPDDYHKVERKQLLSCLRSNPMVVVIGSTYWLVQHALF